MSLFQFFNFNKKCPICDEPLSLYMQWHDSVMWKADKISGSKIMFKPFKFAGTENSFAKFHSSKKDLKINEDDKFIVSCSENKLEADCLPSVLNMAKLHSMHFFYLCNEKGIEVISESSSDYEINLYNSCYQRSSFDVEFKKSPDAEWVLDYVIPETKNMINQDESFLFKKTLLDVEKVYVLSLKELDNVTDFWFYETTSDQRSIETFEPKVFEKQMPLMSVRPNLAIKNRDKLFSRMDSWIIMS